MNLETQAEKDVRLFSFTRYSASAKPSIVLRVSNKKAANSVSHPAIVESACMKRGSHASNGRRHVVYIP